MTGDKYDEMTTAAQVVAGDCRALMTAMPEASIDSIVTDPPYELGFMGKSWDATGIANDIAMWKAALRVLKPGGHLAAFSHSRTYHRMACAVEDAGFEVRDQIMWIYGSGFPKARNLKPAHEPILVARKPFAGSRISCIAEHGTGALNIEACRIEGENTTTKAVRIPGKRSREQYRVGTALGGDVPAPYGRYPANVVHDGSDEVLAGFPIRVSGGTPSRRRADKFRNSYGAFKGGAVKDGIGSSAGSAARFFYCAKASKADRDEGLSHLDEQSVVAYQTGNGASGAASSISEGRETRYRNTHPTVKPTALMRWLCRLVTPAGGTIFDPFTGSGSTGKAAVLEDFDFIGCEMMAEYLPIARARIAAAGAQRGRGS